jgi:hypothetical protein
MTTMIAEKTWHHASAPGTTFVVNSMGECDQLRPIRLDELAANNGLHWPTVCLYKRHDAPTNPAVREWFGILDAEFERVCRQSLTFEQYAAYHAITAAQATVDKTPGLHNPPRVWGGLHDGELFVNIDFEIEDVPGSPFFEKAKAFAEAKKGFGECMDAPDGNERWSYVFDVAQTVTPYALTAFVQRMSDGLNKVWAETHPTT